MNDPTFDPIPDPESAQTASAPAQTEEEPLFMLSGRKRKTIWPFIVIPLVCILLLGGIFAIWYTHPKTVIKQTLGNYAHTWLDGNALLSAFAATTDSGQIHMELSNEDILPAPILFDLYNDSKKGSIAQLSMEEEQFRLYVSEEALMVDGTPLGDAVYGIKPQGIYGQFEASIFHPHADGKYAIPLFEYQLNELRSTFERIERINKPDAPSSDLLSEYYTLFINSLLRDAETKTSNQGDNKLLQITLSPEALEHAIYSFCSTLTKDQELIAYLDTYSPKDPLTDDFDTWSEEFQWLMDEAERISENYRIRKMSLTIRMEYTPFTRKLQSLSVALDSPNTQKIRVLLDTHQEGYATVTMIVEGIDALELRLTQTDDIFRIELATINTRGSLTTVLDLHYTAYEDGSYQLSLKIRGGMILNEFIIKGTTSEGDGVLRITADTFQFKTVGSGSTDGPVKIGLTIELREDADMPVFPETYTDFLAITEGEMDALTERFNANPDGFGPKLKELYEILSENIVVIG